LLSLASELGMDAARLEALRAKKAAERGGFVGRIVWHGNRETRVATASR
jgi:hypothetical protein